MAEVCLLKHHLKKLLPDIDLKSPQIDKVLFSQFLTYDTKVLKILAWHFKSKRATSKIAFNVRDEAKCINKLFPNLTFEYLVEQLEIFKDMRDRKEIVLRIILTSKIHQIADKKATATTSLKRSSPNLLQVPKTASNYCNPIKIRKLSDGPASFTIVHEPTTSGLDKEAVPATRGLPATVSSSSAKEGDSVPVTTSNSPGADSSSETRPRHVQFADIFDPPQGAEHPVVENYAAFPHAQILEDSALPVVREFELSSTGEVLNGVESAEPVSSASDAPKSEDEAPKSLVFEDLFEDNGPDSEIGSSMNKVFKKYLVEMGEIDDDSNDKAPNVQSTNRLGLPPPQGVLSAAATSIDGLPLPQLVFPAAATSKDESVPGLEVPYVPPTAPASARSQDNNNMDMAEGQDSKDFDLIMYLKEITNAPTNFISKECMKLRLDVTKRPPSPILGMIINSLLMNKISSDSSDTEDYSLLTTKLSSGSSDTEDDDGLGASNVDTSIQFLDAKRFFEDRMVPSTSNTSQAVLVAHQPNNNSWNNTVIKAAPRMLKPEETVVIDPSPNEAKSVDLHLVNHLCSIFPDACPNYVKGLCRGKAMNNEVLDSITTIILSTNDQYPKRPPVVRLEPDVVPENQLEILKELLPDADPDFLRMKCDQFEGKPDLVKQFINEAMERKNYPTMKEYLRRQQLSAQERQYTTDFNIENFMKIIPDPHSFFTDPSRVIKMDNLSAHYALVFLRNTFNRLPIRTIQGTFAKKNSNLSETYKELERVDASGVQMKSIRRPIDMPNSIQNIPLLQEIAYYTHLKEINQYLEGIREKEEAERQEALNLGLMKSCGCCYDEEVLPKNIFYCESGCAFCKACIVKSTEVRFGEGKLDFPCLMNCSSNFTLQTLQAVLCPKLFSKIAQKKALEEIKSAGIEELESCPFCDFATIPAEGYNIFTCMNPECMKESCRVCKEPSHIPLRCDEIEKDEDVKARVFVENKMTEALLRKCWKCGIKFFKEEGCNKMTCSCGAQMCYVCGQPVNDYKHFNGNGGDRFDLCPLYSDTNKMNKENVLKAAAEAKTEVGKELKHDPTTDVQQHYQEREKKLPPPPIVNPVDIRQAAAAALAFIARTPPRDQHQVHQQRVHQQRHRHLHHHYHDIFPQHRDRHL